MTALDGLDREQLRELFDLRSRGSAGTVAGYDGDPHPIWHELRRQAPVHSGVVHELTGHPEPAAFIGLPMPERPHFSAFSYEACDRALRDARTYASSLEAAEPSSDAVGYANSLLMMSGEQHRRYRTLVQPSFVPARGPWWVDNWIEATVHALIDGFVDDGRADLNTDFCGAMPILTITASFGVEIEHALAIRAALGDPRELIPMLAPIVAARREEPQNDLVSVLVEAEVDGDDGVQHRLSDNEIYSFSTLLLSAGSGTTWRQMGSTLVALLERPEALAAVRDEPELLRNAVEESIRWMPSNPMFSRFVIEDTELGGTRIPKGSVVHLCLAAANRDPDRWERPDDYDVHRPVKPSLGFGSGPHICLGMHVARAGMLTGIGALLARLPDLRFDPDAEPPSFIGMYHRGPTTIPVLFGASATATPKAG